MALRFIRLRLTRLHCSEILFLLPCLSRAFTSAFWSGGRVLLITVALLGAGGGRAVVASVGYATVLPKSQNGDSLRDPFSTHLSGPLRARVVRVVDGDTVWVTVYIWVHQSVRVMIRLRGIDAPELRGHCPREKDRARQAQVALRELLPEGSWATVTDVSPGKYANRVIGVVHAADGRDVGALLRARGLARPYDGGRRLPWCP